MNERPVTFPQSGILLNIPSFDEIQFTTDFIRGVLPLYNLSKLSNGHIRDDIAIVDAHPIAVAETMSSKPGTFQSRLPLIGIEQVTISPDSLMLGANQTGAYEATPEWLDSLLAIPIRNKMIADDTYAQIQQIIKSKQAAGDKLYVYVNSIIERTAIQISAYSGSSEANRIIKKVLKSVMIEYYRGIQKFGVKPESYSCSPNLYNFDYGETLYGCELEIPFTMRNTNYIIDVDIKELRDLRIGVHGDRFPGDGSTHDVYHAPGRPDFMEYGRQNIELSPK